MNLKNVKIIIVPLALIAFTSYQVLLKKDEKVQNVNRAPSNSYKENSYVGQHKNIVDQKTAQLGPKQEVNQLNAKEIDHNIYFQDKLLKHDAVNALYTKSLNLLPDNNVSKLVAEYIAETPARIVSEDFNSYMDSLLKDLNLNSSQIYSTILESESSLKSDPFIYQMILNLSAKLDLPEIQKARLLGGAIQSKFVIKSDGKMDESSYNITTALILMKNENIPLELVRPYLNGGSNLNKENSQAYAEFKARADAYFPGGL